MPQGGQPAPLSSAKTSEGLAAEVERIVAPALTDMGYDIVRILFSGQRPARLQVMAERHDGASITVDDCAEISRTVSALLDVEDPIAGAYNLEVSSPGIDRPLTRLADFDRFAGFEAKLEMLDGIDGRRRFSGRLRGVEGDSIRLQIDGEDMVVLPFAGLAKAKLVLNDELLAASQAKVGSAEQDGNEKDTNRRDPTTGLN